MKNLVSLARVYIYHTIYIQGTRIVGQSGEREASRNRGSFVQHSDTHTGLTNEKTLVAFLCPKKHKSKVTDRKLSAALLLFA